MTVSERDGLNSGPVREGIRGPWLECKCPLLLWAALGRAYHLVGGSQGRGLPGCQVNTVQLDSGEGEVCPGELTKLPTGSARQEGGD